MTKKTKTILWHLLRHKSSNEIVMALTDSETSKEVWDFCSQRGFSLADASMAISVLFDSIKPTE